VAQRIAEPASACAAFRVVSARQFIAYLALDFRGDADRVTRF